MAHYNKCNLCGTNTNDRAVYKPAATPENAAQLGRHFVPALGTLQGIAIHLAIIYKSGLLYVGGISCI